MIVPSYGYISILVFSLIGLVVYDRSRWLALFPSPRRTLLTIFISVSFFVAWDLAGVGLGIFATNPAYVIGVNLGTPNLPLEEVLLLTLISYLALLLYRALARRGL